MTHQFKSRLKYYLPTTLEHLPIKIIVLITFISILLFSHIGSAADLTCEKQAKEYREIHGGDLIFIQPLKDNGAFDLGEYNGHWMNKAYSKERGFYYYDVESTSYFEDDISQIQYRYYVNTHKKVVVYNVNQEVVPFPLFRSS